MVISSERSKKEILSCIPCHQPSAGAATRHQRLSRMTRKHLRRALVALFREFTGLRVVVRWTPVAPQPWRGVFPTDAEAFCRLICSRDAGRAVCREVAARHVKQALGKGVRPHRFECPFGVSNLWIPLVLREEPLGMVLFQALCPGESGRARKRCAALGLRPTQLRRARRRLVRSGKTAFRRAGKLLALVVDDMLQHAENELERDEVRQTSVALSAHEKLETLLRKELKDVAPRIRQVASGLQMEQRASKLVGKALEYLSENYHRPLTLTEVASELGLCDSYFSAFFSDRVGMPFREYLNQLRMEEAQSALGDPRRRIKDIAAAVGHQDPNSFRQAFKKYTGLSPCAWRNTLHAR
jgi:AraC-like DNA-binding protein